MPEVQQVQTSTQPALTPPQEGQATAPLVIFQLCESCQKNDVCEIWKAALRLKQSLQSITQQYQVQLSGDNIEVVKCNHGLWNTGQEVKA